MSKISPPAQGQQILPWARKITQEINSLQPTAGPGIDITKTAAGTTTSIRNDFRTAVDSNPFVKPTSIEKDPDNPALSVLKLANSYSLEKDSQNTLRLFGFTGKSLELSGITEGDDENVSSDYEALQNADLALRFMPQEDELSNSNKFLVNHSPTLRYGNIMSVLYDVFRGDPNSDDPNPPQEAVTSAVHGDSELPEPRIVSRSIQHNSENGLEIYHFEELQDGDIIPAALTPTDMADKMILIRGTSTVEGTGATVPTVRYMYLSAFRNLDEVEDENLICAWDDENEQLQVYVGDQLKVCYANSHLVTQLAASTITTGWNSVSRATEIWLNVYCEAVNNLVNYANFSSYKWDISNASNDKAAAGLMPVFSILIAKFEGGKVIQYRRGTVEFGQVVPDSKVPNKWKSLEYYDLGNTEDGIQIYQFNNGVNKSTSEDMWKLFDNRYHRSDWGFMIRDSHNGLGDQDEVYYLNVQALVAMCVADCVIPNPLMYSLQSSNIGQGMGDDDVGSVGESLYRFANCSNLRFTRNGNGVITKRECDYTYPMDSISQSTSAYMDIVIRKHHEIGENGLPTVGYIPLSSIFPLSGGGGGSDPVLDSDTGAIGNSIEWNYDGEIQIYHFQDSTGRVGRSDLIANNPDIILRWWNNGIPEVRYTRFNTLSSAIEDAIAPTAGFTGTLSTVCDVRYNQNSHAFEKKFRIDTYENGRLITAVENNNWDNVFTAVPELL